MLICYFVFYLKNNQFDETNSFNLVSDIPEEQKSKMVRAFTLPNIWVCSEKNYTCVVRQATYLGTERVPTRNPNFGYQKLAETWIEGQVK